MIITNKEKLVMQSVQGKIHHPLGRNYRISHTGEPMILPATGGITYNVKIGDSAFGWVGDHVEPGVSIRNEKVDENAALNTLSCIGNSAIVVSGEAKGARGYVTGMHGGIEHVLVYFDEETLFKLSVDDSIMIRSYGQGLKVKGYEDIKIMNIDPDLFEKIGVKEENGKLIVPVVTEVPAYLMGSGIGEGSSYSGDYDIMTADTKVVEEFGIDKLRFGDLVLLKDHDNSFGRGYLKGAVSIGVVIHSDCIKTGHGPGITVIMTCKTDKIIGEVKEDANIDTFIKR